MFIKENKKNCYWLRAVV